MLPFVAAKRMSTIDAGRAIDNVGRRDQAGSEPRASGMAPTNCCFLELLHERSPSPQPHAAGLAALTAARVHCLPHDEPQTTGRHGRGH